MRVGEIDVAALHYLADSVEWRDDRYRTYDLLTELLWRWVAAYPSLVRPTSIGRSRAGRDIWVVTLTNRETDSDHEKPAYYIDANIHAAEVLTSSVVLATIHQLLTRYADDLEARLELPTDRRFLPGSTAAQQLEHLAGRRTTRGRARPDTAVGESRHRPRDYRHWLLSAARRSERCAFRYVRG